MITSKTTELEEQWRIYRDACDSAKNGKLDPLQEAETRQAFFAGCLVMLKFAVEGASKMPTEQAFRYISGLIMEAQTVCRQRTYEMKGRN